MDVDHHRPPDDHQTPSGSASLAPESPYIEVHPAAGKILGHGSTFMDDFEADPYANERRDLPYYPFASRDEWELASFLLRSPLSMKSIDMFLSLSMVRLGSFSLRIIPD